ncbi:hypothetical protein BDV25DRAFT_115218 [Aspergillus avenaceus]|uniref:Uncharacterized protein n=1 Tax=Aspergillus avenaceus TaxID=36643 RepID=A0A5N6TV72_ASPAV|nr:hypothetical protein BDV25DRAFT_115218 [Aspergillus avenaceus]
MTTVHQSENMQPMLPLDGGGTSPPGQNYVQTDRALNPQTSIEDYSRVMLEYTHNRMANFADFDSDKGSPVSRSSRSSAASGESSDSAGGMLRRGPAPTSGGISQHDFAERGGRKSTRDDDHKPSY